MIKFLVGAVVGGSALFFGGWLLAIRTWSRST